MVKKIATSISLFAVGVLLFGCASSGKQFNTTHVNDIQVKRSRQTNDHGLVRRTDAKNYSDK